MNMSVPKTVTDEMIDRALATCPLPLRLNGRYVADFVSAVGLPSVTGGMTRYVGVYGRELFERVIERARTGDPGHAAFVMAYRFGSLAKWSIGVIRRADTGDPSMAAFLMVKHFNLSPELAWDIIKTAEVGDPAFAASCLAARFPFSLADRAMRFIERERIGNPPLAAVNLAANGGADIRWAKGVIEKSEIGDPAIAAHRMALHFPWLRKWAERYIESTEFGSPAIAATWMVETCGSSPEWEKRVVEKGRERGAARTLVARAALDE